MSISCLYFLGKCFCLYSEGELLAENSPQILESNTTPTTLFLKRMEIAGLRQCEFIDRPGKTKNTCVSMFVKALKAFSFEGCWLRQMHQQAALARPKTKPVWCIWEGFFLGERKYRWICLALRLFGLSQPWLSWADRPSLLTMVGSGVLSA